MKNTFFIKVFTLAIFLIMAFFIPKFASAADNNSIVPECAINIMNCDTSSSSCSSRSLSWTTNGYLSGAGNPSCCGDDSQETYITSLCNSTKACCPDSSYIVHDGLCKKTCVGSVSNLRVTQNYFSSTDDLFYIAWEWNSLFIPPSGGTAYYKVVDEDGDDLVGCEIGFTGNSLTLSYDYIGCIEHGSTTPYGPNENHCIKVQAYTYNNGEYLYGPESGYVCATTAQKICGDNTLKSPEGDYSWNTCTVTHSLPWGLALGTSPSSCWKTNKCCGDDTDEKPVPNCSGTANAACCPSTASYYNESTGTCVSSCPVAPTAPSNLEVVSTSCDVGSQNMNIKWADNSSNETGFYLYRRTDTSAPSSADRLPVTLGAGTTQYNDTTTVSGTKYYYWVSSYNGTGESSKVGPVGDWADYIDSVDNLTASQNAAGTSITWNWAAPSGATDYLVIVWNDDPILPFDHYATVSTNSYTITSLSPGSKRGIQVTARFSNDNPWGNSLLNCQSDIVWHTLTADQPPTVFNLYYPANNATMIAPWDSLTWDASLDPEGQAITYNLYYCCSNTANCTLPTNPNYSGISGTIFNPPDPQLGDYCRWNVVASDGVNQRISSNGPFSFRVDQAPNTPSNPSPSDGATCVATNATISWSGGDPDIGDTVTYTVYGCQGVGCNPTAVIGTTNNTSYTGAGFNPGVTIGWKVSASDGDASVTGPVWHFGTTAGTPAATITDGASGSCVTSDTITASWTNGTNPEYAYSADAVCNSSDSYVAGLSVTVSTTHSDYVCFRNSNACATTYSAAQGPLSVDATVPGITSVTASSPRCEKITFTVNGAADTGCAGLAASAYSFDGGATWQAANYKTYDGTSYTINANQIKVRDSLGNTYTYGSSVNGTSSTCPANGTTITVNPGSQACSQSDPTPQITIDDADGVTYGRWNNCTNPTCDPGTTDSNNSPFVCSGSTPCIANINEVVTTGAWKYCARGKDNLGNWSSLICSDGYFNVDKTRPTINTFTIEGASAGGTATISSSGEKPTVKWTTSDVGCGGFDNIQLWRANYNATNCNGTTMTGCGWSQIWADYNEDNATIGRDDTTISDTGDYWYGIHVRDEVDNCTLENNVSCGSTGNPVRVTMNISTPACTIAPGQPTNLVHTSNTTNSITWQWSAPSSGDAPSEYRIYNSSSQLIGTTSGTTYTQTQVSASGANLTSDTSYSVYVVAANSCGTGPASATASAYTSADPPASCSGSAASSTEISWSWISGGRQSEFYASNSAGNTNWTTNTNWNQSGLVCATSYTTSVKARNHDAEETASVQCSISTAICDDGEDPPSGPIAADFQWCAANTSVIIFIDGSTGGTGGVTGWAWNFGDGLGANSLCLNNCNTGSYNGSNQYPVHEYSPSAPPDWANENWVYRRKITFDNSGRSALTNFPVLIKQTSTDTGFWAHVQSDGDDIRFFDSNNSTELYYEIEKFDYAGKELLAWVKVPQVDGTNTDNIYLYYGNTTTGATAYKSPANVWDSNYKMVWHLNDASGRLQDSTSNNIDSSSEGGMTYRATGQIGYGVSLAAGWQASNITRNDVAALRQYPYTWEFWYKGVLASGNQFMWSQDISWRYSNGSTYIYEWKDEGGDDFNVDSVRNSGGTHDGNAWYHGVLTLNNTGNNRVKFYRNGSLFYEGGGTNSPALVGSIDWGTWRWNYPVSAAMTFDEIRISAGVRSADWLAFEYCSMKQTCISYSAEENGSPITDYTVTLTARDSVNNTDQSIQTVRLDPVNYSCAALGCEPACYTPTACTTSQCDNNANGYRYQQIRDSKCGDNCHCPAWSGYQSCQASYTNCPTAAPYNRVDCYEGTGCDTAINTCTCIAGYESDGTGHCKLKEFYFNIITALGSEQLSLTWEKQEIASEYRIYRDLALISTEPAADICNASVCSFTDTGLTPGTTYHYDVFAVVGSGGIYDSTVSPTCHGTLNNQCPRYGTTDSVVQNFTISSICGQLTLGWDHINVGGVSGYTYQIYKGTSPNPTELFKEMAKNQSSCPTGGVECLVCADNAARCTIPDKEIIPKVRYYYKIVTINEDGDPSYEDANANASSYCYEAPSWEER